MKKILTIVALLSCSAGLAYGAASTNWGYASAGIFTVGSTKSLDLKPSANVGFAYAANGSGVTYSVADYHAQGSRAFGTTSTDTNIYYKDITGPGIGTALSGVTLVTAPAAGVGGDFTGWTASK